MYVINYYSGVLRKETWELVCMLSDAGSLDVA